MNSFFNIFHCLHISIWSVIACWHGPLCGTQFYLWGIWLKCRKTLSRQRFGEKKFPSPTLYLGRFTFIQMKRIRTKVLQNRNRMWNHRQKIWVHSLSIVILALDRLCDCCCCYTSWPRTGWWPHFFFKQWMTHETQTSVYCFLKCKSWEVHPIHGGPWETFPSNKDPTRSHNRPSARILACLLQARNGLRNGALWSQVELSCYFIGWCVGKYWQIWTHCQSRRVGRPECNFLGLGDQQSCLMKLWGQSCWEKNDVQFKLPFNPSCHSIDTLNPSCHSDAATIQLQRLAPRFSGSHEGLGQPGCDTFGPWNEEAIPAQGMDHRMKHQFHGMIFKL